MNATAFGMSIVTRLTQRISHGWQPHTLPESDHDVALGRKIANDRALENSRLAVRFNAAREIRQRRIRMGLSQEALATHLGISVAELIAIEIGDTDILLTLDACERLRSEASPSSRAANQG